MTTSGVSEVEAYFRVLKEPASKALGELRALIRRLAPEAEEYMYYQMPAFRMNRALVSYAAFRDHYSLFPLGSTLLDELGPAVSGYRTSKGTLQFKYGSPLPVKVVTAVVLARLEQDAVKSRTRRASGRVRASSARPPRPS